MNIGEANYFLCICTALCTDRCRCGRPLIKRNVKVLSVCNSTIKLFGKLWSYREISVVHRSKLPQNHHVLIKYNPGYLKMSKPELSGTCKVPDITPAFRLCCSQLIPFPACLSQRHAVLFLLSDRLAIKFTACFQVTAKTCHWSGPWTNTHLKKWHSSLLSLQTKFWLVWAWMQEKHEQAQKTWVSHLYCLCVSVNNNRKSQENWEDFPLCFSDSFKHCPSGNSHFDSLIFLLILVSFFPLLLTHSWMFVFSVLQFSLYNDLFSFKSFMYVFTMYLLVSCVNMSMCITEVWFGRVKVNTCQKSGLRGID